MNTTHKLVHTIHTPLWEICIYNFPECLLPWNTCCKSILHDKEVWYTCKTEKEALNALKEMQQTKRNHRYLKGDKISVKRFPLMAPHFNNKEPFTNIQVCKWYLDEVEAARAISKRIALSEELYRYLFLDTRGHTLLNLNNLAQQVCLKYYEFLNDGYFIESNVTSLVEKLSCRLVNHQENALWG